MRFLSDELCESTATEFGKRKLSRKGKCSDNSPRPSVSLLQLNYCESLPIAAGVGIAFTRVCLSVCLSSLYLENGLLLLTPNLVQVFAIAVARHALTQKSKGQTSRSHDYENSQGARLLVTMSRIPYTYTPLCYLRPLPARVCMFIRLPAHV